jgi:hypothetical protein
VQDAIAAFNDIEQLPGTHVNDRGRPLLLTPPSALDEQRLIESQRVERPDPRRIVDQPAAIGDDRVVDRVPVALQIGGDLGDAAPVTPDLPRHPPSRPIAQPQPCAGDRRRQLGPRPDVTVPLRTPPATLAPHQPGAPPERRQVDQRHPITVLDPGPPTTPSTALRPLAHRLDVDHQRRVHPLVDHPQHGHGRQSHKQLAHHGRVSFHRGPVQGEVIDTLSLAGPLCRSYDPTPRLLPKRPDGSRAP